MDYLKREIQIQKRVDHPHIVRLEGFFEDSEYVYIVLEYAEGGNLFHMLKKKRKLPEGEAFIYFLQTAVGIDYLHKSHILHRDLKVILPEDVRPD